jgi:hypothetical protein
MGLKKRKKPSKKNPTRGKNPSSTKNNKKRKMKGQQDESQVRIPPIMGCLENNWLFINLEITEKIWEPIKAQAIINGSAEGEPGEFFSIFAGQQQYKLVLLESTVALDGDENQQTKTIFVHPLYFLEQSKKIRFFYQKTIVEIFKECFKDHSIPCSIKISKAQPELLHIQYEESTLAFLRRIAIAHGLFLLAKPDGSVLVASEKVLASLVKSKKSLTQANSCGANQLKLLEKTTSAKGKNHRLIQYIPKNPSKVFKKSGGGKNGMVFQDHFYHHVESIPRAEKLIRQFNAPEQKNTRYLAQSNNYIKIFTTVEDYFVTKTTLLARQTSASTAHLIHRATITPLDFSYELVRVPPISGIVIGKKKATDIELNTKKKYPRVLVKFHCDPKGQAIPVKIGGLMASGTSYSLFTPEIGTEITAIPINGELMIITTNPNNQHPIPAIQKHIKDYHCGFIFGTRPHPQKYSSFLVNTKKQKEEVALRAQKDMTTQVVEGDYTLEVLGKKTKHSTKITDGNHDLEIKAGNFNINIKKGSGKLCFSEDLTLEAKNIKLKGQNIDFDAKNKLEISCATAKIKAAKMDLDSKIFELKGNMIKLAGTLVKIASKALMSLDSKLLKTKTKLHMAKSDILIQNSKVALLDYKIKTQMVKLHLTVGLFLCDKVLLKGLCIPSL